MIYSVKANGFPSLEDIQEFEDILDILLAQNPNIEKIGLCCTELPMLYENTQKYNHIEFSLRGKEEGIPGIIKVIVENRRNEKSAYYVQGIDFGWQRYHIPLSEFKMITDWDSVTQMSFVLESWNVTDKKGLLLIDDVHFSSIR